MVIERVYPTHTICISISYAAFSTRHINTDIKGRNMLCFRNPTSLLWATWNITVAATKNSKRRKTGVHTLAWWHTVPGIRLAVILPGDNVLKQLPSGDTGDRHTDKMGAVTRGVKKISLPTWKHTMQRISRWLLAVALLWWVLQRKVF